MKKIIITIIIILLFLYISMEVIELVNHRCECDKPIAEEIKKEHHSEYVDYASVEATQRRRGLMIID